MKRNFAHYATDGATAMVMGHSLGIKTVQSLCLTESLFAMVTGVLISVRTTIHSLLLIIEAPSGGRSLGIETVWSLCLMMSQAMFIGNSLVSTDHKFEEPCLYTFSGMCLQGYAVFGLPDTTV